VGNEVTHDAPSTLGATGGTGDLRTDRMRKPFSNHEREYSLTAQ
jgi:hypothetical protein